MASNEIIVPLRSKRQQKALAIQKVNHAIPALGLLVAGQQAIAGGQRGFGFYLGVFELVSAGALIVLTARTLRRSLRGPHHPHPSHHAHGVDWVDIAAGFVFVAEAIEHWHATHHFARPTILAAITTFAFGLSHGRLSAFQARKRVLRVNEQGILVAGRPFKARKLDLPWSDIASIEVAERWGVITTRTGRSRRLELSDLEGEEHVRHALLHARDQLAAAPVEIERTNTAE